MALITSDCGLDQARWRPVSSGCRRMRRMRCLSTRCLLPFRGCCVHGRVMRRPALLVAARCDRPPIVNAAVVDCPPAEWPWSPRICVQSGQVRDRPWPCRAPPGAATDGALSHTTHTQVALLPSLLTLDTVFAVAVLQGGGAGAAAGRRFAGPGGLELCLGSLPLPASGGGGGGVDAGRQPYNPPPLRICVRFSPSKF